MGMSASQANLLSITARMHNIEYKAQNIESQKIQLATQKDELYEDYCAKLDAKKIQIAFGYDGCSKKYVDATFATVAQYDPYRTQQYSLRDADTNKVIVPAEVYRMYHDEHYDSDRYSFAWAMMGLGNSFSWNLDDGSYGGQEGKAVGIGADKRGYDELGGDGYNCSTLMTDVEEMVYNNHCDTDLVLEKYYDDFINEVKDGDDVATESERFHTFRNYLYSNYGCEIYKYMCLDKTNKENTNPEGGVVERDFQDREWDDAKKEFDYYTRLFDQIQACGGCISVDNYTEEGTADNDWFNMMVNSGQMLIDVWVDNKTGWKETSVATCTTQNYLQEVSDDTDLKKAEAEYEHELGIINQKDKKFDQELSKLETERTALKTEMDAIKKVKNDNIDRTFGIFS